MMMSYRVCQDLTKEESEYVQQRLVEFADGHTGARNHRELGLALRDEDGCVLGGLTANIVWDWLQISVLWVDECVRGNGLGHRLLSTAEGLARAQGCRHARLNTFEFEAREFYEQHGYVVRFKTDDFPEGHTQFHMTKEL
jgi:GNAT superfamily N-acetyltransferase